MVAALGSRLIVADPSREEREDERRRAVGVELDEGLVPEAAEGGGVGVDGLVVGEGTEEGAVGVVEVLPP